VFPVQGGKPPKVGKTCVGGIPGDVWHVALAVHQTLPNPHQPVTLVQPVRRHTGFPLHQIIKIPLTDAGVAGQFLEVELPARLMPDFFDGPEQPPIQFRALADVGRLLGGTCQVEEKLIRDPDGMSIIPKEG
jgi:hypothetical protein